MGEGYDPKFFLSASKAWHWKCSLHDPKYPIPDIPTSEIGLIDRQGAQPLRWHGDPWGERSIRRARGKAKTRKVL